MAVRTVRRGFIVYAAAEGRPVTGYLGDKVDVHEDDVERFDRLNGAEVDDTEATAEVTEIEGPDESWTHERIDAFAAEWSIEIPSDGKKDEKLAAITAEIEKRTAEAEAGSLT